MRKTEMSAEQLRTRDVVTSKLLAAGWKPTDWHVEFDKGKHSLYEAELTRRTKAMSLRVTYEAPNHRLFLKIETPSKKATELAIHFGDKLEPVLDTIIGFQDQINSRNFRTHLTSLLRVCPEIDVVRDTVFVRLHADRLPESPGQKAK